MYCCSSVINCKPFIFTIRIIRAKHYPGICVMLAGLVRGVWWASVAWWSS